MFGKIEYRQASAVSARKAGRAALELVMIRFFWYAE